LVLYVHDTKVYKIIFEAKHETLKRAKKVGIHALFTRVENILEEKIFIPKETYDISKGKFIIQYNFKTRDYKIFSGEMV
jgi:hypothetical protein